MSEVTTTASVKAIDLLKTNQSTAERADNFVVSIKRDIQRDILDNLTIRQEKLIDEKFNLKQFTLGTDVNAGLRPMTQDECKKRFERLIEVEYQLELLGKEIEIKTNAFNTYFA